MPSTRTWSLGLALVVSVGAGLALGQQAPQPTAPNAVGGAETTPGPVAQAAPDRRERAISTFKTGRVTIGEVEDAIAASSPLGRTRYERPEELQRLHEQLLRLSLLSTEAEQRGFDRHPAVRKVVMENAIRILISERFDDAKGQQAVPAAEVEKAYAAEHAEFNRPESRRAGLIVLPTKQEAQKVLAQARKADLRAFRKLAREQTTHAPTKLRGGDLRYFDRSGKAEQEGEADVPAPLAKAAFSLTEVGDVYSKVIPMEGGFAVLKLTGKRAAVVQPLKEVEGVLRARLWRAQRKVAIDALIADLKSRHKPEVHAELIAQVRLPEPPMVPKAAGLPAQFPTRGEAAKAEGPGKAATPDPTK